MTPAPRPAPRPRETPDREGTVSTPYDGTREGPVSTPYDGTREGTVPLPGARSAARVARTVLAGVEQLAGGLGTAVLALLLLVWSAATAVLCLVGVGLLLLPPTLRAVRALADRERARLGRWGPRSCPRRRAAGRRSR